MSHSFGHPGLFENRFILELNYLILRNLQTSGVSSFHSYPLKGSDRNEGTAISKSECPQISVNFLVHSGLNGKAITSINNNFYENVFLNLPAIICKLLSFFVMDMVVRPEKSKLNHLV